MSNFNSVNNSQQTQIPDYLSKQQQHSFWTRRKKLLLVGGAIAAASIATVAGVAIAVHSRSAASSAVIVDSNSTSSTSSTAGPLPASPASPIPTDSTVANASHRLIIFGASYSDNGHPRPGIFNHSFAPAPSFGGRHSNGIVWNEYLAQMLGGADLRNYAYAGAMVDNSITNASVPDTNHQIQSFLSDLSSGSILPLSLPGRSLFAVWIGLNPILAMWTSALLHSPITAANEQKILDSLKLTVARLFQQINSLASNLAAARYEADILILPLPPTDDLPFAQYTSSRYSASTSGAKDLALVKRMTDLYNAEVGRQFTLLSSTTVTGIRFTTFDIQSLFKGVIANPASLHLTKVSTACLIGTTACKDPNDYLFWDSFHPTTAMHKHIAQQLLGPIQSLWTQP